MSSKVVPKILEELYEVQPSLREREIEAIRVIELMKQNSPKLEINDDFHTSLRQRLLDEAQVLIPKKQRFYSNWRLYYPMYLTAFASFFVGIFFWGIFGKDIDLNPRIDTSPRGIIYDGMQVAPSIPTSMEKMSIHRDDPALETTHS